METIDKEYKNIIKHNVMKFLSYTILLGFIFALITIIVKMAIHDVYNIFLSISLSLICGIITYLIINFSCRSSSIETFQKHKLNDKDITKFSNEMNLIFILCTIISIVLCIGYLIFFNYSYKSAIQKVYSEYEQISEDLASSIIEEISTEYEHTFISKTFSTIIYEISLVISFISLIPYQKRLIKKLNKN